MELSDSSVADDDVLASLDVSSWLVVSGIVFSASVTAFSFLSTTVFVPSLLDDFFDIILFMDMLLFIDMDFELFFAIDDFELLLDMDILPFLELFIMDDLVGEIVGNMVGNMVAPVGAADAVGLADMVGDTVGDTDAVGLADMVGDTVGDTVGPNVGEAVNDLPIDDLPIIDMALILLLGLIPLFFSGRNSRPEAEFWDVLSTNAAPWSAAKRIQKALRERPMAVQYFVAYF